MLRPGEAADALRVTVRTLARWTDEGKILCVKTPGGQRRYREEDIKQILDPTAYADVTEDNHGKSTYLNGADTEG